MTTSIGINQGEVANIVKDELEVQHQFPEHLKYEKLPDAFPEFTDSKVYVFQSRENGGTIPGGGSTVMRIELSGIYFLDFANSYFMLTFNPGNSRTVKGIASLIQRIRILSESGDVIEDIQDYWRLVQNQAQLTYFVKNTNTSFGQGAGSEAKFQGFETAPSSGERTYGFTLPRVGFWNQPNYIPLFAMKRLTFEFTFADQYGVKGDLNAPLLDITTLSNFYLRARVFRPSRNLFKATMQTVESEKGLPIQFETCRFSGNQFSDYASVNSSAANTLIANSWRIREQVSNATKLEVCVENGRKRDVELRYLPQISIGNDANNAINSHLTDWQLQFGDHYMPRETLSQRELFATSAIATYGSPFFGFQVGIDLPEMVQEHPANDGVFIRGDPCFGVIQFNFKKDLHDVNTGLNLRGREQLVVRHNFKRTSNAGGCTTTDVYFSNYLYFTRTLFVKRDGMYEIVE